VPETTSSALSGTQNRRAPIWVRETTWGALSGTQNGSGRSTFAASFLGARMQ
jgi:hypothetical protein